MKKFIVIALLTLFLYSVLLAQNEYHFDWITATPDTIYADGNLTYSDISVRVIDNAENPIVGVAVYFSTDLGNILHSTYTNDDGISSTTFWDNNDMGTAHILAEIPTGETISIQIEILPLDEQEDTNILLSSVNFKSYPNPFNPMVIFNFNVSKSNQAKSEIRIFNIKGQKITELKLKNTKLGINQLTWNGKDSVGKSVTTGVYIAKLYFGENVVAYKEITLLK